VGRISNFNWIRKQVQGKVLEGYQGGKGVSCVLRENKGEEWKCENFKQF
jgi:hypothetical protein